MAHFFGAVGIVLLMARLATVGTILMGQFTPKIKKICHLLTLELLKSLQTFCIFIRVLMEGRLPVND